MCAKYKAAGVRNISFIALQKGFIAHLAQELTFFSFLQTNYRQLRLSRRHFKNERGISLLQLHGTVVAKHSGPGQKTWDVEISNYSLFLFSIISSLEKRI